MLTDTRADFAIATFLQMQALQDELSQMVDMREALGQMKRRRTQVGRLLVRLCVFVRIGWLRGGKAAIPQSRVHPGVAF